MTNVEMLDFDPDKPDAVFDLDGTVFKFTVLEQYINWLCQQAVFSPLSDEIVQARDLWKSVENNENNYKAHTGHLVDFFVNEVRGKDVRTLLEAAGIVATQIAHRRWDITRNIINYLPPTHNVIAISLMPEWLMPAFTRGLGFVAQLGCTYVENDGTFTGEAYSIDKAEVYASFRGGDTSMLDIAMGDTTGDLTIFRLAERPIAFNPSLSLVSELGNSAAKLLASKDLVTVLGHDHDGLALLELVHCSNAARVIELI